MQPVEVKPETKLLNKLIEDGLVSKPIQTFPFPFKKVPNDFPKSKAISSVKSLPYMPRMSYALKMLINIVDLGF